MQNKHNSFPRITCKTFAQKHQKDFLTLSDLKNWNCPLCFTEIYPFSTINNHDLLTTNYQIANQSPQITPDTIKMKLNLDHIKENISPDSSINCDYYDADGLIQLKQNEITKNHLSILRNHQESGAHFIMCTNT